MQGSFKWTDFILKLRPFWISSLLATVNKAHKKETLKRLALLEMQETLLEMPTEMLTLKTVVLLRTDILTSKL